jgi:hypothetical protein
LRTKRKKTGNPSEIPLLEIPTSIIEKYENDPMCLVEQKLLPVGSNQKMNAYHLTEKHKTKTANERFSNSLNSTYKAPKSRNTSTYKNSSKTIYTGSIGGQY